MLLKRVRFIARVCVRVCVCACVCVRVKNFVNVKREERKRVCYFCAFVAKSLGFHPPLSLR